MMNTKLHQRLLHDYVLSYRTQLTLAMLCMIVMAATTAANAYLMQPALDEIFLRKDATLLTLIPVVIIGVTLVHGLADYGQSLGLRYVGQRVVSNMQGDLFAHLVHADTGAFLDQSSGKLIARLTHDIMLLRNAVSNVLTSFVKESLTLIFLLGVMFYQGWEMAVVAFGVLLFAVLPILQLGRRMRKVAGHTQARLSDFTGQLDEIFNAVRVVKSYSREDYEISRVRRSIAELFTLYFKAARIQVLSGPMMEIVTGVAIAAIIWYGGYSVIHGTTTPGAFFSFITAMLMAYRPIKALAGLNTQWQEGLAAARRFYEAMDTEPTIVDAPGAVTLQAPSPSIVFDNVCFTYPDGREALRNVSFTIPAGKTVALVGPSGGGKTTLMHLLLRFYDATSGSITINDHDIRGVTLSSLRAHMALVSQDIMLFDDSVRANIAYGNLHASEEDIIAAAKRAHAHDFILAMPQGYNTMVGTRGTTLSGGQRQRIAIARALLKNAPVLLLDEATSALDSTSEMHVQQAISAMMKHRTSLIIAHRLSTIRHAHCIVVMDHGGIAEIGTHDELFARGGVYAALCAQQFSRVGTP
jgi:ATP-binding cassette, subfamily B, bacterial MsbA